MTREALDPRDRRSASLDDVLCLFPVLPVVVIEDVSDAVPLANALLRGGAGAMEITLRTDQALAAIERVVLEVPKMVVGAGTVVTPAQAEGAVRAGADFIVTPGSPDELLRAALSLGTPLLAGASTVTEMMRLAEYGLQTMKFFPAEASGGPAYLESLRGPLPDLRFCPTGGITAESARGYLTLPSVVCVGGSWLTPRSAVRSGAWDVIVQLARTAATLA